MGEREEKKGGEEEAEITDGCEARRDEEFKMSSFPTLQKALFRNRSESHAWQAL